MYYAKTDAATRRALLLAVSSFGAGVLNGLLGTGGGMVLIFVLTYLMRGERGKEAFIISSVGVLTFSLVSSVFYGLGGNLDLAALPRFALPAMVGAVAGALLIERISLVWLRRIFAVLLIWSGLKMTGVLG